MVNAVLQESSGVEGKPDARKKLKNEEEKLPSVIRWKNDRRKHSAERNQVIGKQTLLPAKQAPPAWRRRLTANPDSYWAGAFRKRRRQKLKKG